MSEQVLAPPPVQAFAGARVCIEVPNDCEHCQSTGRVPGGRYKAEGEVVVCPLCHGKRWRQVSCSFRQFYELLFAAVDRPRRT